jgi:hypothetical protein
MAGDGVVVATMRVGLGGTAVDVRVTTADSVGRLMDSSAGDSRLSFESHASRQPIKLRLAMMNTTVCTN